MAFWTVNTAPFYIIGLRRQENGILNPVLNASFRMGEKIVPACVQTPEIQWRISSFTIVMSPRGGAGGGYPRGRALARGFRVGTSGRCSAISTDVALGRSRTGLC